MKDSEIKEIVHYAQGHGTLLGALRINEQSLREKGFTPEIIKKVEEALPSAFDINNAFSPWILGLDFVKNTLKLSEEKIMNPETLLLKEIGFSQEEIEAANQYVCGMMTVEGSAALKRRTLQCF